MSVQVKEYYRPSSCGEGQVFSRRWLSKEKSPTAIVQIAHGMCEHSGRYDSFARVLADAGYAVYANDHIGHGLSANGHPGTFCLKKGGFDYLREDMRALFALADSEFPDLPHVLFGHSMGSIAAATYPARDGKLKALILMGSPSPMSIAGLGAMIGHLKAKRKGYTAHSKLLSDMANANMSKGETDPYAAKQWLSHNQENIRKFVEDPLRAADFSASAYAEMLSGLAEYSSRKWPDTVLHIPTLILGGGQDSVGGNGRGPAEYHRRLLMAGHSDASFKLYPRDKHELLNEADHAKVEKDILDFIAAKLAK